MRIVKVTSVWSVDAHQYSVLRRRYSSIVLGDARAIFSLFLQSFLIGISIVGVWKNITGDSLALYFVMCLSSFFFGAINSCREIVKERVLFLRERMFNLCVPAYVLSKYWVQILILFVQSVFLSVMVDLFITLDISVFVIILVLMLVGGAGISVGLLVSSWVRSSDKAVVFVPLLVIPQILFSDFVLGADQLSNWTGHAQNLMPVYWGYEFLKESWQTNPEWSTYFSSLVVLSLLMIAGYGLTVLRLVKVRE